MVKIYGNVIISPPQEVNLKQDDANVGNKKKIVCIDISSSTTVAAGASETITIQPPQGKIWKNILFRISIPAPGGSSGNHYLKIHSYIASTYDPLLISGSYDKAIYLADNYVLSDTGFASRQDAMLFLRQLYASHDYPIIIYYRNATDVDQANTRTIKLIVEEEDEAP